MFIFLFEMWLFLFSLDFAFTYSWTLITALCLRTLLFPVYTYPLENLVIDLILDVIPLLNLIPNRYFQFSPVTWAEHLEQINSVQFRRSVVSDSLWPHESQHTRPPRPSPTPGVHSNSCPSSQWCHPAISSSVVPFSSCPQSLPASESFPMSQLFAWGGQSTGVSALASFLPKKSQGR